MTNEDEDVQDTETIISHVDAGKPLTNGYISCFSALIRDARLLAGRCQRTGIVQRDPVSKWGAALLYMVLVDQIGSCFEPSGHLTSEPLPMLENENEWITAMASFGRYVYPKLRTDTVYALYALRCCLAHSYSLFNKGKGWTRERRQLLTHRFLLGWSGADWLAHIPENRLADDDTPRMDTVVNLLAVCQLCEDIALTVEELAGQGKLTTKISIDDLTGKYRMYTGG